MTNTADLSQDRRLTRPEIELAYEVALGRKPGPKEVKNLQNRGPRLSRIQRMFFASSEFSQHVQNRMPDFDIQIAPVTPPRVALLHIPKTGSQLLQRGLQEAAAADSWVSVDQDPSPQDMAKAKLILDARSFGATRKLPPNTTCVCLLRRPADRLISLYHHIASTPDHPLHGVITGQDLSFGAFLEYTATQPDLRVAFDNTQMRVVAGLIGPKTMGQEQKIFTKAVSHLSTNQIMFGRTETFGAFQYRLKKLGVLSQVYIPPVKTAGSSFLDHRDAMTDTQRRLFDHYIAWDNLLYQICKAIEPDSPSTVKTPSQV